MVSGLSCRLPVSYDGCPLCGEIMIGLARYQVLRHFDGTGVQWLIYKRAAMIVKPTVKAWCDSPEAIGSFETREEAVAERNRLNSEYGLDQLGI